MPSPDSYDDGIDWPGFQKFFDEVRSEEKKRWPGWRGYRAELASLPGIYWGQEHQKVHDEATRRGEITTVVVGSYNNGVAPPAKPALTDSDKAMLKACGMIWEEKGPLAIAREQIAAYEAEALTRKSKKSWDDWIEELRKQETDD